MNRRFSSYKKGPAWRVEELAGANFSEANPGGLFAADRERRMAEKKEKRQTWIAGFHRGAGREKFAVIRRLRHVCSTRDHGVCAGCGVDTVALMQALRWIEAQVKQHRLGFEFSMVQFMRALGFNHWTLKRNTLWDVDHVIPRAQGGTNDDDNLRTLCFRCHKARHAKKRVTP